MKTKNLRTILAEVVASQVPADEPVALLFSGGTDSLTILWTLLDLNVPVHCYTFRLSYYESTDAKASAAACRYWNVPRTVVTEGTGPVLDHLRQLIPAIRSARKTHVEVMYGYWWLLQAVKERHVFSGLQADTLYGSNKNAAIQCGKASAEDFARYRRKLLEYDGQEGLAQAVILAERFSKTIHTPYSSEPIREFFCGMDWRRINRPKQKMPAIEAFHERFSELAIYRIDDNFQCGSRLREHCAPYVKQYREILRGAK